MDRKSNMKNELLAGSTLAVPRIDPFELLQKHADEFGLRAVAQMVRLAPRSSPLHGAAFKYTNEGAWSLKPRPGVEPEAAARELCRLLGVL